MPIVNKRPYGGRRVARARVLFAALIATLCGPLPADRVEAGPVDPGSGDAYVREIEEWRHAREERLKADDGWLTVAGLFWLDEGVSRIGSDPACEVRLPEGSAPDLAGTLTRDGASITVRIEPGVPATIDGQPVTSHEMRPDSSGSPDVLELGDLTMYVIERGGRYGIRLKDRNSRMRREFTGLRWYPVRSSHRIEGRFVPYEQPKEIPIPTVLKTTESMTSPGYVVFTVGGTEVRFDPVLEGSDRLWFIFSDGTSGRDTYPSGRFLKSALPVDGRIVLDFNLAYNPPCAYTPFATCPLPPPQNRLDVPIEAGELDYGHH
ncbi:MAG: DUF1684 domain-containing protein [Acidobacteria bacterium]|nr:DUF1684 domain-containing protein [Acidobacteriota bacterium]